MTTVTITDIGSDEVTIPVSDESDIIIQTLSDGPPLGNYIADHSQAINLGADDHPQYLNVARGDARYTAKAHEEDTTIHFTLDDVVVSADDVINLDQPSILYQYHIGNPDNIDSLIQPYSTVLYDTTASFTIEYKEDLDRLIPLLETKEVLLTNSTEPFTTVLKSKLDGIEANATADQLAIDVSYSNTASSLTATNVQSAIDELNTNISIVNITESQISDFGSYQPLDIILTNTTASFTIEKDIKLTSIEEGAEVNNISDLDATDLTDTGDSTLHYHSSDRDRSNHTGLQNLNTVINSNIIGFPENNKTLDQIIGIQESAGITNVVNITSDSFGNVNFSAIEYLIRSTENGTGVLYSGKLDASTINIPINTSAVIYLDYGLGTPSLAYTPIFTEINVSNKIPLAIVYRGNSTLHILNTTSDSRDCNAKFRKRSFYTEPYYLASGGLITNPSGLGISISEGKYWFGLTEIAHIAKGEVDLFKYYYFNGTTWIATSGVNQIDPINYNDITSGLVAVPNKGYVNHWIYALFGGYAGEYGIIYGQVAHTTFSEAISETSPNNLPDLFKNLGCLIGVVTTYEDTPLVLNNIRTIKNNSLTASIPNHNELSGLDVGDYIHLKLTTTIPTSGTDVGIAGTIAYDATYAYICVANNTWIRTALTAWT